MLPPLPDAIILVLAPFAPLFSHRVWLHAQLLLLGAMLTSGPRTVTAALRVMGLASERHFTNYHRVLTRATWSGRQASRILLGVLIMLLVPRGATIVLGADDTVERCSGRQITAKGCYRDAVRSSKKHVIRCFGPKWVSMMLLVPVPRARRVWALPFLTALCWPAEKAKRRRHKTSVDWVWQMMQQVRRWLPTRLLRSALFQLDGMEVLVSLIVSGACENYPDLKFVLGESGVTWIPYVLDRSDTEYEDRARALGFSLKPSDYFRRNGYTTYQQDPCLEPIIPLVGEDNIIWGADYPHPDCVWPESRQHIAANLDTCQSACVARSPARTW